MNRYSLIQRARPIITNAPESTAVPGIARALRLVGLLGSAARKTEAAINAIIERNIRGMSQKSARLTPGFRYKAAILL